jgi:hypothetical protein
MYRLSLDHQKQEQDIYRQNHHHDKICNLYDHNYLFKQANPFYNQGARSNNTSASYAKKAFPETQHTKELSPRASQRGSPAHSKAGSRRASQNPSQRGSPRYARREHLSPRAGKNLSMNRSRDSYPVSSNPANPRNDPRNSVVDSWMYTHQKR